MLARSGSIPILPTASQNKCMTYINCCIYRAVPPDDKQQACWKHVEVNYWNRLKVNSASCWFLLYGYITMHGQQNIKYVKVCKRLSQWSLSIDHGIDRLLTKTFQYFHSSLPFQYRVLYVFRLQESTVVIYFVLLFTFVCSQIVEFSCICNTCSCSVAYCDHLLLKCYYWFLVSDFIPFISSCSFVNTL
jgi:hypothetical protein